MQDPVSVLGLGVSSDFVCGDQACSNRSECARPQVVMVIDANPPYAGECLAAQGFKKVDFGAFDIHLQEIDVLGRAGRQDVVKRHHLDPRLAFSCGRVQDHDAMIDASTRLYYRAESTPASDRDLMQHGAMRPGLKIAPKHRRIRRRGFNRDNRRCRRLTGDPERERADIRPEIDDEVSVFWAIEMIGIGFETQISTIVSQSPLPSADI